MYCKMLVINHICCNSQQQHEVERPAQDRLLRLAAAQEDLHVIVVARSRSICEEGEPPSSPSPSPPPKPVPPPNVLSRQLSLRDRLLKRRLLVREEIQWCSSDNGARKRSDQRVGDPK